MSFFVFQHLDGFSMELGKGSKVEVSLGGGGDFGLIVITPYGKFDLALKPCTTVDELRTTIKQKAFWLQQRNEGANSNVSTSNSLQIWTNMGTKLFFLDPPELEKDNAHTVGKYFRKKDILWVKVQRR
jgi:hypothetical protein